MRIIAISDVHECWHDFDLPKGDMLVVAGDLCERRDGSFAKADAWFASVKDAFEKAVYVPGNHDANIIVQPMKYERLAPSLLAAMLVDETIELSGGFRLHAMPWETENRDYPEAQIPENLDVLVSHEPPFGILDWSPKTKDVRLGNHELLKRVRSVRPRLHVFGHCHAAYGSQMVGATTFVNVAICGDPNKYYGAYHPPTVIDIDVDAIQVTQWR